MFNAVTPPDLGGHSILIVDSAVNRFVGDLQGAIENAGAESLVVRSPEAAMERIKQFTFSAAVINAAYGSLADQLEVPCLVYGTDAPAARPEAIVVALARLLAV